MAKKKREKKSKQPSQFSEHFGFRLREGYLLMLWALSVFVFLALVTHNRADPAWSNAVATDHIKNAGGQVGAYLSDVLLYLFGYLAYSFPILISYGAWLYYQQKHSEKEVAPIKAWVMAVKAFGFCLLLINGCGCIAIIFSHLGASLPYHSGGVLGYLMSTLLVGKLNEVGATMLMFTLSLCGATLFSGVSWFKAAELVGRYSLLYLQKARNWLQDFDWVYAVQKVKMIVLRKRQAYPDTPEGEQKALLTLVNQVDAQESTLSHLNPSSHKKKTKARKIKTPRYARSDAMPDLSLLEDHHNRNSNQAHSSAVRSSEVEQRLADFGVTVKVTAVMPGPVVTRYELELAAGTKVSKITGLAKDLARSLSVISVRVVEVIPGKPVVGLELPNEKRGIVSLQQVLASDRYINARSPLSLALGNDIAGHPVVVDLAKMPHLLVAGTTGSGKSVALNSMLLSLLYKSTPEQLRLILIDPKMLELSVYDGIPHLLTPVVTDMKDASSALRWCVAEMERRYRLMSSLGVRNLEGYNKKIRDAIKRGAPLLDPLGDEEAKELQELPQIVVIADEFADMMVVVGKKVETLIARLAQKARAAGIHLVLATQRPSVDVITGLIKANIPTRIAFQVSSKVDSRTIIDQQGAEQLLGHGDMLYLPPGTSLPVRVHGAFVSDDEVHNVVSYLKEQSQPEYIEDILDENLSTDPTGYTNALSGDLDGEQDELYDEAVAFVVKARKVSVSSVQRRFKIGYNRAARIVETMETAGVVSKAEGYGPREVLAPALED